MHLISYEVVFTAKTHLGQNVTNVSVESPDLHHSTPRKILIGALAIIDMENLDLERLGNFNTDSEQLAKQESKRV